MNVLPNEDPRDFVDRPLHQLDALTRTLYGSTGDGFRQCSNEVQSAVMWLIADLVDEVRVGVAAIGVQP